MKTKRFFKNFAIAVIAAGGLCWSCQSKNEYDMQVSLEGTNWKLVGIVDNTPTGELKTLKPQNCADVWEEYGEDLWGESCDWFVEMCYTLSFEKENSIIAFATASKLIGNYEVDYNTHNMKVCLTLAEAAGEWFDDGWIYREILQTIHSFSFTKRELRLYFNDNNNYLLFKPRRKS